MSKVTFIHNHQHLHILDWDHKDGRPGAVWGSIEVEKSNAGFWKDIQKLEIPNQNIHGISSAQINAISVIDGYPDRWVFMLLCDPYKHDADFIVNGDWRNRYYVMFEPIICRDIIGIINDYIPNLVYDQNYNVQGALVDGQKQGQWTFWYENRKGAQGMYIDDKKIIDTWSYWNVDGTAIPTIHSQFDESKPHTVAIFGGRGRGKTTLLRSIIRSYERERTFVFTRANHEWKNWKTLDYSHENINDVIDQQIDKVNRAYKSNQTMPETITIVMDDFDGCDNAEMRVLQNIVNKLLMNARHDKINIIIAAQYNICLNVGQLSQFDYVLDDIGPGQEIRRKAIRLVGGGYNVDLHRLLFEHRDNNINTWTMYDSWKAQMYIVNLPPVY